MSTQLFNEWRTVYLFYKRILTSLLVFFMLTTIYASNQQRVPQNSVSLNESVPRGPFFHVSNLNSDLQTHDGTLELERPRPNFRMKRKPKVLPERLFTKRRRLERNTTNDALNLQSFGNGIQMIPVESENESFVSSESSPNHLQSLTRIASFQYVDSNPQSDPRLRRIENNQNDTPDQVNVPTEERFTSNSKMVLTTTRFRLGCITKDRYVNVLGGNADFFQYLQNNLASLPQQKGKLKFLLKNTETKNINLPGLSYEAVKSFTIAINESSIEGPPNDIQYLLATTIPKNEDDQKKLMIQVAQMVCVAIRLKFAKDRLFSLLDWYKKRMKGVWETLLQSKSGNDCVKEVAEARRESIPSSFSLNGIELTPIPSESFSMETEDNAVNRSPNPRDYELQNGIPVDLDDQMELMSQIAEMVCTAIRLQLDVVECLLILDFYQERMIGVWERLLESGNEFAKEIEESLDPIIVAWTLWQITKV